METVSLHFIVCFSSRKYTARNSIASSTIFKSKPELLGNVTNELPRKMVKIENPIAKLCHYLGTFSQVSPSLFLVKKIISITYFYLILIQI